MQCQIQHPVASQRIQPLLYLPRESCRAHDIVHHNRLQDHPVPFLAASLQYCGAGDGSGSSEMSTNCNEMMLTRAFCSCACVSIILR